MPGVVDADTHISESEGMWELMAPSMYPRRPVMTEVPDDTLYADINVLWLIDGNLFPKPAGRGGFRLVTPSRSKGQVRRQDVLIACREITDVPARLADMDRLGVEVQVIYPTLFLVYLTEDPPWRPRCAAPTTTGWRTSGPGPRGGCGGWWCRRCIPWKRPWRK